MARSLRDELLRAGLVTREQVTRAKRGIPPPAKPAKSKAAAEARQRRQGPNARRPPKRPPQDAEGRKLSPPRPAPAAQPDPDHRVRQLNVEIRRILDAEGERAEPESDTPFHFARGDRLKRLYVSEDQRRRLVAGELAIVGFGGRHHLVPPLAGERVRELREEVFVFISDAAARPHAVEDGYEGFDVPDGLIW